MKLKKTLRTSFALILVAIAASVPAKAEDDISLLVPSFESDQGAVGRAVSSYIGLNIWRTLVRARDGETFGQGNVFWGSELPSPPQFTAAEVRARSMAVLAQLVLWGEAFHYGDGYIAETHLSMPRYKDFRETSNEIWSIKVDGTGVLEADLPRRRYSFEPIILRQNLIEKYSISPGVPIFADQTFKEVIGVLGAQIVAETVLPSAAKVRSGGVSGWIQLAPLADQPSEVVDFVAGLIRIYRGDWVGAREMFQRVLESDFVPTEIVSDAALLSARASAELGIDPGPDMEFAERSGSVTRTFVQYSVMSNIEYALNSDSAKPLANASSALNGAQKYFTEDDPWITSAREMLQLLLRRLEPAI